MNLKKNLKNLMMLVVLLTCSTFCMAQKQDLSRLITAIATVESKLNEKAVSSDCVGYLQIRPVLVRECNILLKAQKQKKRYTLNDRFSKEKSIEMFYLIQSKYNPSFDIVKALCIWNAGPFSKRRPTAYIARIMKVYHKL
jgi:hypothetical protein|nr:MAG TPA: hypothetical protein [Ackermannviridae sp.]